MDGFMNHSSLSALKNLLVQPDENDLSDDDEMKINSSVSKFNPGNIGPQKKNVDVEQEKKKKSNDIWDESEITNGSELTDIDDSRPQPDYEYIYKQGVTTEDIYLQMGNKSQGSSSCEEMIVKIKLPGAKISEIDVDVKKQFIDLRCPQYKLGLHLPHPVNHKDGKAQWIAKDSVLLVTLKMQREYDFVNF